MPNLETILKLAAALSVSPTALIEGLVWVPQEIEPSNQTFG